MFFHSPPRRRRPRSGHGGDGCSHRSPPRRRPRNGRRVADRIGVVGLKRHLSLAKRVIRAALLLRATKYIITAIYALVKRDVSPLNQFVVAVFEVRISYAALSAA